MELAKLKELHSDPANALEIGRASEHLVVFDLVMQGYRAFLTEQGMPYDIVVDDNGKFVRVQVKAACFTRNVNSAGRNERVAYSWNVRRVGENGCQRLSNNDCDIVALAALDIKRIAYVPVSACSETVTMMVLPEAGRFGYTISELEDFSQALAGKPRGLSMGGRKAAIRRNGQLAFLGGTNGLLE